MLVFDNVTYTYPNAGTPAVRDISLSVSAGEIVLCTGPSGCGKSTLIRLANGLCPHFFRGRPWSSSDCLAWNMSRRACCGIRTGTIFSAMGVN